jgi:uncharacterized phage protein (TIGR02220 family)
MPRARNIKPGLYKNEDLAECSIWARYIFPGLWMLADREGRLEDRPKRIKGELLPFDSEDIEPLLRELDAHRFILRYEVDGVRYIQILKFKEHQAPHYSEKKSVIPEPPFQETCCDQEGRIPGNCCHDDVTLPEISGATPSLRGGRNPLIPDSLIPDSLIPEVPTKAGKPAVINGHRQAAREILDFLNAKAGRSYEPVDANLTLIGARLKEATVDDVKAVIEKKCADWGSDARMSEYLRPKTLFNATNFANYKGEIGKSASSVPKERL